MPLRSLTFFPLVVLLFVAGCDAPREGPADNMRTAPVESISASGILVDTWCYSRNDETRSRSWPPRVDTACSNQSMRLGYPVAVVVDIDSVWVLSESPRIFAKFLNDSVRVSGDIRSEGVLIPRTFERRVQDTWQTIF